MTLSIYKGRVGVSNAGSGENYRGTWDASTNTPTLPNPPTSPSYNQGDYYQVSAGGTQFGITFSEGDEIIAVSDGLGGLEWAKKDGGLGDVVGPASSTDNTYALFDGVTGKIIKDSEQVFIKHNPSAGLDPTVNDDDTQGYSPLSTWANTITEHAFICTDNTTGAAVWDQITGGGSAQNPTYTIPTLDISGSESGDKEVGDSITQSLTLTADKNDSGTFTRLQIFRDVTSLAVDNSPAGTPIADIPAQFGFTDPNNPNESYSLAYSDTTFIVPEGDTTWSGQSDYDAGLPKKNSAGSTDSRTAAERSTNAPQAAGSNFDSNIITVTGIYPYFYAVSDTQLSSAMIGAAIAGGTTTKVLSSASGSITINFGNGDPKYLYFAHVATDTTKTKWTDSTNPLNTGPIGAAPSEDTFEYLGTENVNSPDALWSGVSFKIYETTFATDFTSSVIFSNS